MSGSFFALVKIVAIILCIPLPYGTDHRLRRIPFVTYGLIALNVLVFIGLQFSVQAASPGYSPFLRWGLVPRHPQFAALFTSLFLHVSVLHILWNMAFLWLFGRSVEDALGHVSYLILYFGGGVAAGLLHMAIVLLFAQNTAAATFPLVGASGAISAVLGVYSIRFYGSKLLLYCVGPSLLRREWGDLEVPAIYGLGLWLGLEVWDAVASLFHPDRGGIAYWAHIGGFVFGMLAAVLTDMLGEGAREYLLTEAKSARERGDDRGLAAAVRRYWVILQRRPDDEEAHAHLCELVAAAGEPGSEAYLALAAECTALMDVSLSLGDRDRAIAWRKELIACGFDPPLPPRILSFLAGSLLQKDEYQQAADLYYRLLDRFPDSPEAEWTFLELATLELGHLNSSARASELLRAFLDKFPASAHRSLAMSLLESAASRSHAK